MVPNIESSIAFISDTVAASVRLKSSAQDANVARGYLAHLVALVCTDISRLFAASPLPLALRGYVSLGRHIAKDTFLLGPAVDEAATNAGMPQGAFAWLSPEAVRALSEYETNLRNVLPGSLDQLPVDAAVLAVNNRIAVSELYAPLLASGSADEGAIWWKNLAPAKQQHVALMILKQGASQYRDDFIVRGYPMPMKGGGVLKADVINPLHMVPPDDHAKWIPTLLSSFRGSGVDILMKQQNTERFLAVASDTTKAAIERTRASMNASRAELQSMTGISF